MSCPVAWTVSKGLSPADVVTLSPDLTEFCKLALVVMGEQMMKQAETQTWGTRERNWSSPEISYVWDGVRYGVGQRGGVWCWAGGGVRYGVG